MRIMFSRIASLTPVRRDLSVIVSTHPSSSAGTFSVQETHHNEASLLEVHMSSHAGMKAMVLAAGVGCLLDLLTSLTTQPLLRSVNCPVRQLILRLLMRHGVTQTISNVHYMHDKVTRYFGTGSQLGINMDFVYEPVLTGDAGGVRACREF